MSAYPSLPLFTDAFIADTGHLSAQETGAYLMLMMVAWRSPECRLPDTDDKLARWARVDRRTWLRIKPAVMEFWTLADGFWSQKRLSKEREFVSKRAEVNRRNGEQGGRPKSLKNNDTTNPAGYPRVSETKAPNPSPNPIDQTGAPHLSDACGVADFPPRAFELWWDQQPNKVAKDAARAAFDRIRKSGRATFAELMDGLLRYIANKPPHRDYCHPSTWLNQGRWADEPAPTAPDPRTSAPRPSGNGLSDLGKQKAQGDVSIYRDPFAHLDRPRAGRAAAADDDRRAGPSGDPEGIDEAERGRLVDFDRMRAVAGRA